MLFTFACLLAACLAPLGARAADALLRSEPLHFARDGKTGFSLASPEMTGVRFTNQLSELDAAANRVLETGSGVAAGDFDGDGKVDLFFCSLQGDCRLYRNLGQLRFDDVTAQSGIRCAGLVCRAAVFADVDSDGREDLLISAMGRGVLCFRNIGGGRFEDFTAAAGTASPFGSMSITLADVDGNGTLDLYVANYRTNDIRDAGRVDLQSVNGRTVVPPNLQNRFLLVEGKVQEYGEPDLLYLNDGKGHFHPVPWARGAFLDEDGQPVKHAPYDWSLTASFRDLNGDGAPDLYVCGDYWTPDRIWMNDGHGIFRALRREALRHTSASSMGVDFADIDGDGHLDFFVADMLALSSTRRLTQMPSYTGPPALIGEIFDRPQINRNTLFHNRGDGTFEEIAQLSGLEASDWSWEPLFVDVDLDGRPDLLIASGHTHTVQDADADEMTERTRPKWPVTAKEVTIEGEQMPFAQAFIRERMRELRSYPQYASPLYAFHNSGDLRFENTTVDWGLDRNAIRHGMALADLDGDGDLDLVVNVLNGPAEVWINNSPKDRVAVELKGWQPNTSSVGAMLLLSSPNLPMQSREVTVGGQYLSNSQRRAVFAAQIAMKLEVRWRSGEKSVFENLAPNQIYYVFEPER